ncbi:MAG: hypothetical protein IPG81_26210 [Sandaracinaceae bacterium]|nr:hypothetical protein [Sandaracinaceae bacterium]
MGAYSTLCAFDVDRLRAHAAPAIRAELAAEADVHLERDCALLDDTLGIAAASPAAMALVIPLLNGACSSESCAVSARCPMHVSQSARVSAEVFGARVKAAVLACCVAQPADVVLGRYGTAFHLACFHERAHGRDDPDAFLAHDAPFVQLATCLTRRAAAWGWGDGGHGEGVLGWLDAEEARSLAGELDALLALREGAPSLDGDSAYDEALRTMACSLRDQAVRCASAGLGVLLRRD